MRIDQHETLPQAGGNMEGKEGAVRTGEFGDLGGVDDGGIERIGEFDA